MNVKAKPTTRDAYRLFHEGSIALSHVEANGMRIDVDYLDRTINRVSQRITSETAKLRDDDVYARWVRKYGEKTKLGSRPQLAEVLTQMGYELKESEETGRKKVDADNLERLELPFLKRYLRVEQLKKLRTTYLLGVRKECVGEWLRPSFPLNFVTSYRSSSRHPNFHNIPIRDPQIGRLIRRAFIPRDGHVLLEVDYGALEFRIAACFWEDPEMVAYASDPNKDIHRDVAALCFGLPKDEITKEMRHCGKNQFVFPQLYGDYYVNCGRNIWSSSAEMKTKDDSLVRDHFAAKGWDSEEFYLQHIKSVEKRFNKRFSDYDRKGAKWWKDYSERGWFDLLTGFRIYGVYTKNFIRNAPIQGPAFHCLLWSLIRIQRWLDDNNMRTKLIGQIHDSMLFDVYEPELDQLLKKVKQVMTVDLREHWGWIITPLEVEAEVAKTNWFEKEAIAI